MKKTHLFLFLSLVLLTLTLLLSGCGSKGQDLDGKYVATFELNGGTLDISTSNVSDKINYAYDPGAYLLDPSTYGNYKLYRSGYKFTGWFKTPDCNESDKWNFKTDTINSEKITLYAGWEREIRYTFTVCFMNDKNEREVLGSYNVTPGEAFEDFRRLADKRDGYTANGYFSDEKCETPWNFETKHPGGDTDTDISVYVSYIPGEWIFVSNYKDLKSAMGKGNIYLTCDIDCGGQEFSYKGTFNQIFEGNGFTVSNFTVPKSGSTAIPSSAIFESLGPKAELRNVKFTNVTYRFSDLEIARKIKVSALAVNATEGYVIRNVSITGKMITDGSNKEELQFSADDLNRAFYEASEGGTVENLTIELTLEKQP